MLENLFGQSDRDLTNHINGEMIYPSGEVDDIKIKEPDRFDYNERMYAVMEPLTNEETGEKKLVYDVGHPIPRLHRDEEMGSVELMNEISGESIIEQLAKPSDAHGMPDIIAKLKEIPPVIWIVILVVFVMLQQGTLSGLMPGF